MLPISSHKLVYWITLGVYALIIIVCSIYLYRVERTNYIDSVHLAKTLPISILMGSALISAAILQIGKK